MQTTQLNNGRKVLAHETGKYQGEAVSYTNYRQAQSSVEKLMTQGINARLYVGIGRRTIYIQIED